LAGSLLLADGTAWAAGTVNTEIQTLLKAQRVPELHWGHFPDVIKGASKNCFSGNHDLAQSIS
jgi:hypothetical protein